MELRAMPILATARASRPQPTISHGDWQLLGGASSLCRRRRAENARRASEGGGTTIRLSIEVLVTSNQALEEGLGLPEADIVAGGGIYPIAPTYNIHYPGIQLLFFSSPLGALHRSGSTRPTWEIPVRARYFSSSEGLPKWLRQKNPNAGSER